MTIAEARLARTYYMTELKNGIAASVQDLSKGFVPIVLVVAMIGSAVFVASKIERLAVQLEHTTEAVGEVKESVATLTELGKDVERHSAMMEQQATLNVQTERDIRMIENTLKHMEIALGKAGIEVR